MKTNNLTKKMLNLTKTMFNLTKTMLNLTKTLLNLTKTILLYLQVKLNTDDIYITSVECGGDGTIFISDEGLMYGCGGNKGNKLGLDGPAGWLLSGEEY